MSSGVTVRGPWHARHDVSTSGCTSASNDCAAAAPGSSAATTAIHADCLRSLTSTTLLLLQPMQRYLEHQR